MYRTEVTVGAEAPDRGREGRGGEGLGEGEGEGEGSTSPLSSYSLS